MANENAVQPQEPRWVKWLAYGGSASALFYVLFYYVAILLGPIGVDPENSLIRGTAIPIVFWPFWAMWLQAANRTKTAMPGISDAAFYRAMYAVLCILFLFHVAIAFHLGHGWSHRDAFERTERISGFGPGIFVSYAFIAVWVADVIWSWVSFDSYLSRPKWLTGAILGFMGFIWFNAVIVFGSWIFRFIAIWPVLMMWRNNWSLRWCVRRRNARAPRRVASDQ